VAAEAFVNREAELAALEALWRSPRPELLVLYGRRRVGKTELLRRFCQGKPAVYFLAAQVKEADNLDRFVRAVRDGLPHLDLSAMAFRDWPAALAFLARQAARAPVAVILDEFPYLCEENPSLPSLLQAFWDQQARGTRLKLVLCGSHVSFMERSVLAERSPLFGRRTAQQRLLPLSPFDAVRFFPRHPPAERLILYGITGGTPAYLALMDPGRDIRDNVLETALRVQGYLYEEVPFLLRTELVAPATYASLLTAVAGGCTRLNEIAQRAGVEPTTAGKYLTVLRDLALLRRDVAFFDRAPERSRRGLYLIQDNFILFWFRFILPHQAAVEAGQGARVYDEIILPALEGYMGPIFEEVCREYVRLRWPAHHETLIRRVGRHWERDWDLDVVAEDARGRLLVGECKWARGPVGRDALSRFRERAASHPLLADRRSQLLYFSRAGFTPAAVRFGVQSGMQLLGLRTLLGE
jgi:AAA+ ATPase superfamily predicted ATPase